MEVSPIGTGAHDGVGRNARGELAQASPATGYRPPTRQHQPQIAARKTRANAQAGTIPQFNVTRRDLAPPHARRRVSVFFSDIAEAHGGVIDKFVGDAVMVWLKR